MKNTAELTGSEKQIKWAADIRTRFLNDNESGSADVAALAAIQDAKFWIETRNFDGFRMMAIAKGIQQGESWQAVLREIR